MTFIHIDLTQVLHTCPADPEPHVYDTIRTVVAIVDGGPCRQPITVRSGHVEAIIPCGRREPYRRQCPACRTTVVERTITSIHTGHHGPQHPNTTGVAA